jgi:hypothetical protein
MQSIIMHAFVKDTRHTTDVNFWAAGCCKTDVEFEPDYS